MSENKNESKVRLENDEYINALFLGTRHVNESLEKIIECLRGQLNTTRSETPFIVSFFRIHLLVKSSLKLNSPQDFQLMTSIARTMFELLIDLKILMDDKVGNSVEKYHYFRDVMIYRRAKTLKNFFTKTARKPEHTAYELFEKYYDDETRKNELDKIALKYWDSLDIIDKKHWSMENNIRERAKLFGDEYEQLYVEFFPMFNLYIHGGSSGFFGFSEDGLKAVYGQSLFFIQDIYLRAARLIIKRFELHKGFPGLNEEVEDLSKSSLKLMKNMYLKRLQIKNEQEMDGLQDS